MEGVGRGWMMLDGEGTVTMHQGNECECSWGRSH